MSQELKIDLKGGRSITVQVSDAPRSTEPRWKLAKSIPELERCLGDPSIPESEKHKIRRLLTDYVARQMRAVDTSPFARITVGRETIILDACDRHTLQEQFARGQSLIAACKDHRKERCDCWLAVREWIWNQQHIRPKSSIAIAATELLWDAVAQFAREYERPKDADPVHALVSTMQEFVDSKTYEPLKGQRR